MFVNDRQYDLLEELQWLAFLAAVNYLEPCISHGLADQRLQVDGLHYDTLDIL